ARAAGPARAAGQRAAAGGKAKAPVKCRVCGRVLTEAVERKLRRCADCPSTLDEALYERLRDWRSSQARSQSLPPYCVFTDATLLAIAETLPKTLNQLAGISGVGRAKLDKYGEAVLSLCGGVLPGESQVEFPEEFPEEAGGSAPDDISDFWDESDARENSPEK
ncbi:HRDC domain-containing protein, partial [Streptacidiphilus monticola]